MSTPESHLSTPASTHFPPPADCPQAGREWKLRGYRPDTSIFMGQLRRRQPAPFISHISWQQETRLLARYCTDPDVTLADLIHGFIIRRPELKDMFRHYGLDYYTRNHAKGVR